ncbi:MAG: Fe-S protein assembly co-chaperone HscB [Betaproteobacteria bacterium]|nr:Fe-S protein assembly co-chaperone HscB [Betaproteobacteria bacterium]
MISLQASDFELFGLPTAFALDRSHLDLQWKSLQREAHPDRFASEGAAAQRIAMQWSVRINEAYSRLKDPLKRAAYLCELHGAAVNAENNTSMPPAFLIQQMEWREALDDCKALKEADAKIQALEKLLAEVDASHAQVLAQAAHLMDADHNYTTAVGQVRALMFIEKFAQEVQHGLDACT